MSVFNCSFCQTNRRFVSFAKMFQHITLYHQSEPNFSITCDLHAKCGVLYKTYSAYKSHVYRQHVSELRFKKKWNDNSNGNPNENLNQEFIDDYGWAPGITNDHDDAFDSFDEYFDAVLMDDGCATDIYNPDLFFGSFDSNESFSELLQIIKRSYILFILKLREEFLLPQGVTNIISTYIVSLISHLEILLHKKAVLPVVDIDSSLTSSLTKPNEKVIEVSQLHEIFNDLTHMIESISKNNYQFMKNCEKYFDFNSPEEVVLSSPGESVERAYFIPIDRTLAFMLKSQPLLMEISKNIQQRRIIVEDDPDLMFSVRDAQFGHRFDEDSLLIQVYLDDIGLTNPLGAKRDKHKMTMVYFSLEDVPDKYRSKLDFIQLVAVCESKHLKVNFLMRNSNRYLLYRNREL